MTPKLQPDPNLSFYNRNAEQLAQQYDSKPFTEVHQSWSHHLADIFVALAVNSSTNLLATQANAVAYSKELQILDIGAGTGRDAKYLAELANAQQQVMVYAVEPATELAAIGKQHTQDLAVIWLEDTLPELEQVTATNIKFDLILLSAVWMHIPSTERLRALTQLCQLLAPQGKLIITLRHGPSGDERIMHSVSIQELALLSQQLGLSIIDSISAETDKLGRAEVSWETVVIQFSSAVTAKATVHNNSNSLKTAEQAK
ncbi:class I SAM-dependent methyltransferase [Shewanella halifaxensis]|uniref:class I SAM-dependent methyltransferase n=1 Tax=Shewanella halifaxensis TaxID=271098 RepID=UPI000D59C15C|nr:class I SAM-dependent methyltransferase [Shewanella halifaxensis]